MSTEFSINSLAFLVALLIAGLALLLWLWKRSLPKPYVSYSNLQDLKVDTPNWRIALAPLPSYLLYASLAAFLLAFIDPHLSIPRKLSEEDKPKISPTEGIAIYLVLDQSGSMTDKIYATDSEGNTQRISKIDLVKTMSGEFVKQRPNDLIGLIFFARVPQIIDPLTLDHSVILKDLSHFNVIQEETYDATGIGYAIYKTANLISATRHYAADLIKAGKPAYDIKSAIIVLLTDGFQQPSPLDAGNRLRLMGLDEAAQFAKQEGVKVYLVNVDPSMSTDEFAPMRHQMERITALTGGKYYLIDSVNSLSNIFADIDQLEKSELPPDALQGIPKDELPQFYQRLTFAPYLISLGVLCLLLSILLHTLVLRRIP